MSDSAGFGGRIGHWVEDTDGNDELSPRSVPEASWDDTCVTSVSGRRYDWRRREERDEQLEVRVLACDGRGPSDAWLPGRWVGGPRFLPWSPPWSWDETCPTGLLGPGRGSWEVLSPPCPWGPSRSPVALAPGDAEGQGGPRQTRPGGPRRVPRTCWERKGTVTQAVSPPQGLQPPKRTDPVGRATHRKSLPPGAEGLRLWCWGDWAGTPSIHPVQVGPSAQVCPVPTLRGPAWRVPSSPGTAPSSPPLPPGLSSRRTDSGHR